MTERGPFTGLRGAPDPAEPSNPGGSSAPASRPQAAALPADLGEVRRTDAAIEALAAWRASRSAPRSVPAPADRPETGRPRQADDPDPAVRLLRALITDVDDPESGDEARLEAGRESAPPCPPKPSGPGNGPRRRGPRTIVALGVAGAVLASTGVAAAGGGATDRSSAAPPVPSTSSGAADDAAKPARADTDAGTHDQVRPPVRPAPKPERPAAKRSGEPGDREGARPRRALPFPFGPRPREHDIPAVTVHSMPGAGTDDARDGDDRDGRRTDDSRRRTQKRTNEYENPYTRD